MNGNNQKRLVCICITLWISLALCVTAFYSVCIQIMMGFYRLPINNLIYQQCTVAPVTSHAMPHSRWIGRGKGLKTGSFIMNTVWIITYSMLVLFEFLFPARSLHLNQIFWLRFVLTSLFNNKGTPLFCLVLS